MIGPPCQKRRVGEKREGEAARRESGRKGTLVGGEEGDARRWGEGVVSESREGC